MRIQHPRNRRQHCPQNERLQLDQPHVLARALVTLLSIHVEFVSVLPFLPITFERKITTPPLKEHAILDELKLPKTLARRLEKAVAYAHINPETIARTAIKDRLDYLEWKENAIAAGQADLDSGNVVSTDHIRASLTTQRAQRATKSRKAA